MTRPAIEASLPALVARTQPTVPRITYVKK